MTKRTKLRALADWLDRLDEARGAEGDEVQRELRTWAAGPPVITLCGSTKFLDAFKEHALRLTLAGNVVLSIGTHEPVSREYADGKGGFKPRLDELHLRKIDLSDSIFVLNVGGYVGESTRREIEYAKSVGVVVEYLEEPS